MKLQHDAISEAYEKMVAERSQVSLKVFHGTGKDFDQFSSDFARVEEDYYGGGVAYFTDNKEVAFGYASDCGALKFMFGILTYAYSGSCMVLRKK